MTNSPVDCAEIRSGFVAGRVPAGPGVDAHLQACPHCRELFEHEAKLGRRLALSVLPAVESVDLFARLDADLSREVGVRARLRALPTSVRASALAAGAAATFLVAQLFVRRRGDLAEYSPALFWLVALVLVSAAGVGVWRLVRGASAPLRAGERDRAFATLLLLLPALLALLAPLGDAGAAAEDAAAAWSASGNCFVFGAVSAVPIVTLIWLLERRDRVPLAALVSAGALAGVAANLLLHVHCASSHLGHLLLGHASVGLAWAFALSFVARRARAA